MATCNPTELLAAGKCFDCLDEGLKQTIKLQLLCEIANGSGDSGITQLTGDVTAGPGSGSQAATIAARAVTFAKLQAISTSRVLGRLTAGSGDVEELTITGSGNVVFSASPTFTGTALAEGVTMSGRLINSVNGALSAPAFSVTGTPIAGGTGATTKPLVLIEPAGTTSTGWDVNGSMLGINMASSFASGYAIDVQKAGSRVFSVYNSGTVAMTGNISVSGTATLGGDVTLRRAAAANLALGAADAASPVAQTISVQSVVGGTTDTAGANLTIAGSRSTGSALGGEIVLQTAASASSGSSQNSLVSQLRIMPSGGFRVGGAGASSPWVFSFTGNTAANAGSVTTSGIGLSAYANVGSTASQDSFAFTGVTQNPGSGSSQHFALWRTFAPTTGNAVWTMLGINPTINQTGGASGITRGLYINPTLTAAADFRALEISDGNVVLPKTVTAGGTTGNQTINKLTGSVNFAAAATSLTVTNSYVTTSSIITATVATNDATMKSVLVVASAGSFVIHANAAATAETRVNWKVTN